MHLIGQDCHDHLHGPACKARARHERVVVRGEHDALWWRGLQEHMAQSRCLLHHLLLPINCTPTYLHSCVHKLQAPQAMAVLGSSDAASSSSSSTLPDIQAFSVIARRSLTDILDRVSG